MNYLKKFGSLKVADTDKPTGDARKANAKVHNITSTFKEQKYRARAERLFSSSRRKPAGSSNSPLGFMKHIAATMSSATINQNKHDIVEDIIYPNYTRNGNPSCVNLGSNQDELPTTYKKKHGYSSSDLDVNDSIQMGVDLEENIRGPHIDQMTCPLIIENEVGGCISLRNNFFKYLYSDPHMNFFDDKHIDLDFEALESISMDQQTLGPPDMIHITCPNSKFVSEEIGQFFFVTGIPCWNIDLVLQYMKSVYVSAIVPEKGGKMFKKGSLRSGLPPLNSSHFDGTVTLFMYDMFRGYDVRLRYDIRNDSYQIYVYDPFQGTSIGSPTDIDELTLWDELMISNIIRSFKFNKDNSWKLPGLVEMNSYLNCNELVMVFDILYRMLEYMPSLVLKSSMDETEDNEINYLNNYMVSSLLDILHFSPKYYDAVVDKLEEIRSNYDDISLDIQECYDVIYLLILLKSDNHELKFVEKLKIMFQKYMKNQWIISQLIFLQLEYLVNVKKNYELALKLNLNLIKLKPHMFLPWTYLSSIYFHTNEYQKLLTCLNNFPKNFQNEKYSLKLKYISFFQKYYIQEYFIDKGDNSFMLKATQVDYLSRIFKINNDDILNFSKGKCFQPLPNLQTNGYLESIWNNKVILQHSPVFGNKTFNLMNFVSVKELEMLQKTNIKLFTKYSNNSKESNLYFDNNLYYETKCDQFVYGILIDLIFKIGSSNFQKMKNDIFINGTGPTTESYINDSHYIQTTQNMTNNLGKRVCESWFQKMIDTVYQDYELIQEYRVSTQTPDNNTKNTNPNPNPIKNNDDDTGVRKSRLEWNLYGCLLHKNKFYKESILCYRTCLNNRFDPISAHAILDICLIGNSGVGHKYLEVNVLLQILFKLISYDFRFYNNLQLENIDYLKKVLSLYYNNDIELMISEIYVLLSAKDSSMSSFDIKSMQPSNHDDDKTSTAIAVSSSSSTKIKKTNDNRSLLNAVNYLIKNYIM